MNEFGNFLNSDISDELQQHSIRLNKFNKIQDGLEIPR